MTSVDVAIAHLIVGCLTLLWIVAAIHKLRDPSAHETAVAQYALIPEWAVPATAAVLPWAELAIGVGLIFARPVAASASAGLLLVYALAIGINLARGRTDIDCGCSGPALRQPLSFRLVGRNVVLIAASGALLLPASPRTLHWFDGVTILLGILIVTSIYAAVEQLLSASNGSRVLFPAVRT